MGKLSWASRSFLFHQAYCLIRLDDSLTWQQTFIVDGGSSYPWSRFMAGCPILISMASLTFLLNQMSSLASTLKVRSYERVLSAVLWQRQNWESVQTSDVRPRYVNFISCTDCVAIVTRSPHERREMPRSSRHRWLAVVSITVSLTSRSRTSSNSTNTLFT